jgi:methylated-DNA-[protein]-cysteine S-methyltransferase
MSVSFALFQTRIGTGGIAWSQRGVRGVLLPEAEAPRARARMKRRFPDAVEAPPAPDIEQTIARMAALLNGETSDLTSVPLDLQDVPPFDRDVYAIARTIPVGETLTYGEIARRLGNVRLAREVGQALGRNPLPIVVPCHRVIAADGRLGGFSARGGVSTKQRLLAIERANVGWQLRLEV